MRHGKCITRRKCTTQVVLILTYVHVLMSIRLCRGWDSQQNRIERKLLWWRHQMEIFSALLAICAGNSPVSGEFPAQRPATRSFDVFFDLCLNKRLSKQSRGWWFETLYRPLWPHCNVQLVFMPWRTHAMKTLSALLFLSEGNSHASGGCPSKRTNNAELVFLIFALDKR